MKSVVATMKTLAAARIRQFETAADATESYSVTVELALQILMQNRTAAHQLNQLTRDNELTGLVLLGSDQGFCGRFNEAVLQTALRFARQVRGQTPPPLVLAVGSRMGQLADASEFDVHHILNVPTSVSDITTVLQQVILQIESWQTELDVGRIEVFYHQRRSTSSFKVNQLQLLPLANDFLQRLGSKKWQSRSLPIYHGPWRDLFSRVIQQYLFLQLFRACAESLASENASRMVAMQKAEKNIEKRLSELSSEFNENRQRSITEELLEIMSGFEAVTTKED